MYQITCITSNYVSFLENILFDSATLDRHLQFFVSEIKKEQKEYDQRIFPSNSMPVIAYMYLDSRTLGKLQRS